MDKKERDKQQAIEALKKLLHPGMTVYTVSKHTSQSGMMRVISLKVIIDNQVHNIDFPASVLLEGYSDRWDGCKIGGCGFDVGFESVYRIAYALFPDGFECIGDKCPSNDHNNGDRDYSPHHHKSGGYALKHEWM